MSIQTALPEVPEVVVQPIAVLGVQVLLVRETTEEVREVHVAQVAAAAVRDLLVELVFRVQASVNQLVAQQVMEY
jgi:hypothetical protein